MNSGKFVDSIRHAKDFLRDLNLLKEADSTNMKTCSPFKFSEDFRKSNPKTEYKQTYIIGIENGDFDFMLNDNSFLQYSYSNEEKKNSNGILSKSRNS